MRRQHRLASGGPAKLFPLLIIFLSATSCEQVVPDALETELAITDESAAERRAEEEILLHAREPWTGDLNGMYDRGFVRVLTTYSLVGYFLDGFREMGLEHELSEAFEDKLNKERPKDTRPVNVVVIPVPIDQLLARLTRGEGDIAAANLTITPKRQELVNFADPMWTDVRELVVTGPASPPVSSLEDLAATGVHLRASSSYYEHLAALNQARAAAGKPTIPVVRADENLEDKDLLDLVNAGTIPAVIVDSHIATLWVQFLANVTLHEKLAIHSGGEIAWAVRKNSPQLRAKINEFVKDVRRGTLLGNVLLKRYLKERKWIDNPLGEATRARFEQVAGIIQRYADQYDFDWLMIAAQGYQESGLDQSRRSPKGAIGVMQVLPTTARDPNVNIPNIEELEPNIHAGVKYLHFLRERYFSEPHIAAIDRLLFSLAAYNAGPRKIREARNRADTMGFDPNRWFRNVEVAASKTISREPVVYVRKIYKYFVAYRLAQRPPALRAHSNSRNLMIQ